jgi:hypothetical protein
MSLPGFLAPASLEKRAVNFPWGGQLFATGDTADRARVDPQLMPLGGEGLSCWSVGGEIICAEGDAFWGGGSPGGPGRGGVAKASCLSGDGSKLCHCPKNCFATQYTCYCTS